MSVVVAVRSPSGVVVGADSIATTETLTMRADPITSGKLFRNGPFVIGVVGSFRFANLLRFWEAPVPKDDIEPGDFVRFMVTEWVPALKNFLKEVGETEAIGGEKEEGLSTAAVIGYKGSLVTLFGDFQIAELIEDYIAIGFGAELAMGSLYTTGIVKSYPPDMRVTLAIRACDHHSPYACEPILLISTNTSYAWSEATDEGLPPLKELDTAIDLKLKRVARNRL